MHSIVPWPVEITYRLAKGGVKLTFWLMKMGGRYVSGRPMDGKIRTDASLHFFRRGTRAMTPDGVASDWAMAPGWWRAAWRVGVPTSVTMTYWAYTEAPILTTGALATLVGGAGVRGGKKAVRRHRSRVVHREYVQPIGATLAPVLKQDAAKLDEWVHIPAELVHETTAHGLLDRVALPSWVNIPTTLIRAKRAWKKRKNQWQKTVRKSMKTLERTPDSVWIRYPADLLVTPDLQKAVAATLDMKLGGDDWNIVWHGKGSAPYISVKPKPKPPDEVLFAEVLEYFQNAKPARPLLGMTATGPLYLDLDIDAPHFAVSCGTGAGKSIFMRSLIAHFLHHGAQVIILDGKRTSQKWCKDLPGIRYCRTAPQMHEALIELHAEAERRFEVLDSVPADSEERPDVGPRIVLLFEEQNIGVQGLTSYWANERTREDPKRSPALDGLDAVLCTGREALMHVISVAQLFTVQASGGNPTARSIYGPRALARADRNAWMMLAPECAPFPKQTKRRGRMHLSFEGNLHEYQVPLLTVAEARNWATSGEPVTVPAEWTAPHQQRRETVTGEPVTPEPTRYTLAEAVREGIVPMEYDQLRQRKSRSKTPFPKGVMRGKRETWTAEQLQEWLGNELELSLTEPSTGEE